MKKKIMVFTLLLSLVVALVVPVRAKAAAEDYTFEDWCIDNGYECQTASDEDWSDSSYHFNGYDSKNDYLVFLYNGNIRVRITIILVNNFDSVLCYYYDNDNFCFKTHNDGTIRINSWIYEYHSDGWHFIGGNTGENVDGSGLKVNAVSMDDILYSSDDIYSDSSITDVIFEKSVKAYTFYDWCTDAGLNCVVSSNELNEIYPFEHDLNYWYLVRKNRISGSEYTWYLSQVNIEPEHIYYVTARALADNTIGAFDLALDEGTADYSSSTVKVNNYVYDSSGGGWLYVERTSTDLGFTNPYYMDDIGITFSSTMPIVFSSTDIYSDKEQSAVYYVANTEYVDSEVEYPIISPTSTPTPTPTTAPDDEQSSSGSGRPGTGSRPEVDDTGGLGFIVDLFTLIWEKLCSVPMSVDGYSITLQQVYIYGALVVIVGGFIIRFIFKR